MENAFGMLKGRFRVCKKSELHAPKFLARVVAACCALHNMCLRLNDDTRND